MRGLLIFLTIVGYVFASGYDYLNQLRLQAGMIPLSKNQILEQTAKNHNRYMIANNVYGHYESQAYEFFTGVTPVDRAIFAGYPSRYVLENIAAGTTNIKDAIDDLFSAIYHRFGFLNFTIDEVGGAFDRNTSFGYETVATFNMGNSELARLCAGPEFSGYGAYVYNVCVDQNKKIEASSYMSAIENRANSNPSMVLWPYEDARDIPPVFYEEEPDPLPECSVSGYPMSVNFNPFKTEGTPVLIDFRLEDSHGREIPLLKAMTHDNDPNGHFSKYDFAIFPEKRLQWGEIYQATFIYVLNDQIYTKHWSFRTRTLPGDYYEVQDFEKSYPVISGKKYFFYIPPRDCNDVIRSYQYTFPYGVTVDIGFYDHNTIWLQLDGEIGSEVDIWLNNRRLKVVIDSTDNAKNFSSYSSSSSSVSLSCPEGYVYVDGMCLAEDIVDRIDEGSSSSLNTMQQQCEKEGGTWIENTCIYSSTSSSSNEDIARKLSGKVVDITGYFAYYGDLDNYDPFAWVYLSRNGRIFVKLEGMNEQTGGLIWTHLEDYFEEITFQNGVIKVGKILDCSNLEISGCVNPPSPIVDIAKKIEDRTLPVAGYFAYYGDTQNYNPFDWIYVSRSENLLAKLMGMDPETGNLRWEYLIGKGQRKIQDVKIIGGKIYIGEAVEDYFGVLPPFE